MKLLILNGPNINLLGKREKNIYGEKSYDELIKYINEYVLDKDISLDIYQSNHEGELIDYLQKTINNGYDGVIFNAGGYTHTSVSIRDCIKAINIPVVEVHLSNILHRELFRRKDLLNKVCVKRIMGYGFDSYTKAIDYFLGK